MNDRSLKHAYFIASAAILVIAAALRLYHLGDTSLWLDEAVYANNSYTSFTNFIFNTRHHNSSPILLPLLYWLLGDLVRDPFWIRVPPMIFGLLSVYVLLTLPKVGLSRSVSMISALWLAILPVQIQYSQEVREYSLSVLVSCLLIFSFLKTTTEKERQRFPVELCIMLFLAPLAAYGNIFLAGLLLALFILIEFLKRRFSWSNTILLTIALFVSLLITYFLTARYQMNVSHYSYLVGNYPHEDILHKIKWFIEQNANYFSFLLGGINPEVAYFLIFGVFLITVMERRLFDCPEVYIVSLFVGLIVASNGLALLHLYPFGGIRQQLFASPVLILATVSAGMWFLRNYKYKNITLLLFILVYVVPSSWINISRAYSEVEDIISPVSQINPGIEDRSVFVYSSAIPAIKFHYPKRKFYLSKSGRGHIESMINEVVKLGNRKIYLLFSHIYMADDQQLLSQLKKAGYVVLDDKKFKRSRLILMEKSR